MKNLYVITGTTKGLGYALVEALRQDTNNDVIEISRGVSGKNASNAFMEADFADAKKLSAVLATLPARLGNTTYARAVLINNAGVVEPVDRFDAIDVEALSRNITVNVTAPIMIAQAFANATKHRAASRLIVNISSGAAKRAIAGWTAYCAAKAALEMATRVMAAEAGVNDPTLAICSLAPGVIDTPMQAIIRDKTRDAFPDVERFLDMKRDGVLRGADAVARDIISLIQNNKLANGGNFDIREIQ
jgi:benzil reductase ((S)-benzoin forming)